MSYSQQRQNIEKDKKAVFVKDIVTKNPIFSKEDIEVFFQLFNLYADERRQCNVHDIVNTAKTLGFDTKHKLVFDAFQMIAQQLDGEWTRFEPFLTSLTNKLGNPFTEEGRKAMFYLVDLQGKQRLTFSDLIKISDYLGFNLTPPEIEQILKQIVGSGKKQLSWNQFNEHIMKKIEKKASFF